MGDLGGRLAAADGGLRSGGDFGLFHPARTAPSSAPAGLGRDVEGVSSGVVEPVAVRNLPVVPLSGWGVDSYLGDSLLLLNLSEFGQFPDGSQILAGPEAGFPEFGQQLFRAFRRLQGLFGWGQVDSLGQFPDLLTGDPHVAEVQPLGFSRLLGPGFFGRSVSGWAGAPAGIERFRRGGAFPGRRPRPCPEWAGSGFRIPGPARGRGPGVGGCRCGLLAVPATILSSWSGFPPGWGLGGDGLRSLTDGVATSPGG